MALDTQGTIQLPGPQLNGALTVEGALSARRSVREFSAQALSLDEVGQLLWAAQGITSAYPLGCVRLLQPARFILWK